MKIVRFYKPKEGLHLGVLEDENRVLDATSLSEGRITSFLDLIQKEEMPADFLQSIIALSRGERAYDYNELAKAPKENTVPHLVLPIRPPEVWAAGVTYKRSAEARLRESQVKDVYDRVYAAERPELFLKATGPRVVGPGEPIGLRSDSKWMVPEPELGVVLGENLAILGYIIGNDVSARDTEGENPLYLPQAKIFNNSCALGPIITLAEGIKDPYSLNIRCDIHREGALVFSETANTRQLKRRVEDLVSFLGRDYTIYPGTVLLTGTCIIPPDSFTLKIGDIVNISIDHLGTLSNTVSQ